MRGNNLRSVINWTWYETANIIYPQSTPSNWLVVRAKVLRKLPRTLVVTTNFITVILPDVI
ncbi:hypothetical protein E5S67_05418 [Microcoleus sp. IPMA8]|uniref:Uncharacterized protein n=1 Tax=Microcoleus asticus IPMA8 TaxID=2563858 RepID=A0ABX2D538_9CYAN|nr:hypothetical protein [Microcoleus asticus IPMA8]